MKELKKITSKETNNEAKYVGNKIIVPGCYSNEIRHTILDLNYNKKEYSEVVDGIYCRVFEIL